MPPQPSRTYPLVSVTRVMRVCCVGDGARVTPRYMAIGSTGGVHGSDGDDELIERVCDVAPVVAVDRQVVMPSTDVLHQGVTGSDDRSRPGPFQSPHGPQPGP